MFGVVNSWCKKNSWVLLVITCVTHLFKVAISACPFSYKNIGTVAQSMMMAALITCLAACSQSPDDTPVQTNAAGSSIAGGVGAQPVVASLKVLDVAYVDSGVLAPLSVTSSGAISSVTWRQIAGPTTTIVDATNANAWVLMPFTQSATQVNMAFQVSTLLASGEQLSAIQQIVLMPISPQVVVSNRWLNAQNAVLNISANFQHAVFGDGSFSSEGSIGGPGQLPVDPNNPAGSQQVTLPIIWRDDPAKISRTLINPPQTISFNLSRLAELTVPLTFEPLPATSDSPFEVVSLQFDIVLPTGERSPVSIFVRRPINSSIESSSSLASLNSSSSLISESSSSVVLTINSSQAQLSEASSDISSSNAMAVSSSALVSSSISSSSSSLIVASSSSGPSERELAVAAICADSWQGLGSLPTSHANYQTESPYVNAEPFIDPVYVQHIEQSQQLEAENTALVAAMEMLKSQPTGVWLDSAAGLCASVNGKPSLVEYLNLAEARNQLLTLVLYNIPARDCVRQERPGDFDATEQGLADYQKFVDRFSALTNLYPNVPIAAVVEPAAFASTVSNGGIAISGCYVARQMQAHERSLDYALKRLAGSPNIFTYLDYGDPTWPGSYNGDQALVDLLESSKLADGSLAIEGISLNIGSYVPLDEPFMLAQDSSGEPYTLPKGVHSVNAHVDYLREYLQESAGSAMPMLVDTARNGWGGEQRPSLPAVGEEARVDRRGYRDAWCNVIEAGLGERWDASASLDFLWVMPPTLSLGESSVACDSSGQLERYRMKIGAPAAGAWFHNYFVDLINNAYPPLIMPAMPKPVLPLNVTVKPTQIPVQSAANVQMTIQLPSSVAFTSLSLRFAGEDVALDADWLGQNSVAIFMDIVPLTYFHDVLKITAIGTDGNRFYQEVAVFDSPKFDGKPIMDIALGGGGFFPDFYRLYRADLPAYTYTNNGFEGDDFLWVSEVTHIKGGEGDDYIQAGIAEGGPGNDTLVSATRVIGGSGSDFIYAAGSNVLVIDDLNDFDIVHWSGRNFTENDPKYAYEFVADGDDLVATEVRDNAEDGVLTVKGFFADPPHINEIHYGDGQILTPEIAREMLGLNAQ